MRRARSLPTANVPMEVQTKSDIPRKCKWSLHNIFRLIKVFNFFAIKKVPQKITIINKNVKGYHLTNKFKFWSELRFENVKSVDSGNYTCVATNKFGVTETSGTLNVLGTSAAMDTTSKTLNFDVGKLLWSVMNAFFFRNRICMIWHFVLF